MANIEKRKLFLSCFCLIAVIVQGDSFKFRDQSEEDPYAKWPARLTWGETKTHDMLGTALLKRIFTRVDHTETFLKAEINQMYENLKDLIQKNFKKCDRTRRNFDNPKIQNSPNQNQTEKSSNKKGKDNKRDKKSEKGKKKEKRPEEYSQNSGSYSH